MRLQRPLLRPFLPSGKCKTQVRWLRANVRALAGGILNYFAAWQTSGPVEGINTKARVIVKRCYGLKSADSLWTRLVLELN